MDDALFGTHRTVADHHFVDLAGDLERHFPAVATPPISFHSCTRRIRLKEPPENTPRCSATQLNGEYQRNAPRNRGFFVQAPDKGRTTIILVLTITLLDPIHCIDTAF